MRYKICAECKQKKIIPDDFYKDQRTRDGYYNICKTCFNKRRQRYYKNRKLNQK